METTTNEQQRTKEVVLEDFANTVLQVKYSFILYNTVLNRLEHTYKDKLDINLLSNEERDQLNRILSDMQFHLLNAQIYYRSVCKKKNIPADVHNILIVKIDKVMMEYVPDRLEFKEIVMELNDFLVSKMSSDLKNDMDLVKGVTNG